jgi:archaellum component FlaC
MGELVDQLGNKSSGQIIRSEDWNDLVSAVENNHAVVNQRIDALTASVQTQFNAVNGSIQDLSGQLAELHGALNGFRASIEPILGQYYRVTLEATRINYTIGQIAELTARVTSLQGKPLDLRDPATRPWVDFVVTWGQLKPVAGFESLGGVGDRTLTVRVNAGGIAQVRLRADHVEGFTDEAEDEVAASLTTRLPELNKSVAEVILESNTPLEAKGSGAFRMMTLEYDRNDALSVRQYVDTYFMKNAAAVTGKIIPPFRTRWRDYRSTVMAFAKADNDPRTPDQSRGVSSIQITFRDWISPWISLDYMDITVAAVQIARDRLTPRVTGNLAESAGLLKDEVNQMVRGKGLIGKQRDYQIIHAALDQVNVSQPPQFLNTLTKSVQNAVNIQQSLENTQAAAFGPGDQQVAFDVFTATAVQAGTGVEEIKQGLSALQRQLQSVERNFSGVSGEVTRLQTSLSSLGGRMDATIAEGGEIQRLRSDLKTVSQKVEVLRDLDPSSVRTKLIEVESLTNRVTNLERLR